MTMDNDKNLTPLIDEDLLHVAGGTGTWNVGEDSDYCDACAGGPKSITMDGNQRQLTCANCGKIFTRCPKCGGIIGPTDLCIENGGVLFLCHANRHSFIAY